MRGRQAELDERGGPDGRSTLAPALLTGTSAEFLGRKPLPRLLGQRRVWFVLGPAGAGKTSVATSLCMGARIEPRDIDQALVDRVRTGRWSEGLATAPGLVLDGPHWLVHRPGAVSLLLELARARAADGLRTVVCQGEEDGSVEALIAGCEPGLAAVVGLRFPVGRKSRLRTAFQVCQDLGLPRTAALGTDGLDPWRYDLLRAHLIERATRPGGDGHG